MSRPKETAADVTKVLADCYNLQTVRVTELVSFESRNFAVEVLPLVLNKDDQNERTGPENGRDMCEELAKSKNSVNKDHHYDHHGKNEKFPKKASTVQPEYQNGMTELHEERITCEESIVKLVLKIFNSALSLSTPERLPVTTQQVLHSQFLRQRGFRCPQIVYTSQGELFGRTALQSHTLLMTMLEGQQLGVDHSKISSRVLFEVGALLACVHQALQEADPQHLEPDPTDPWVQENLHLSVDYLHCIQDEDERSLFEGILTKFQQIRHKFPTLKKGIIHGDFHDYNLLVDWEASDSPSPPSSPPPSSQCPTPPPPSLQGAHKCCAILHKYGIIDFEGMTLSYPALELGQLIADMMIDCRKVSLLDIGGYVLAGYVGIDSEVLEQCGEFLYDVVLASLAHVVVLSTYGYQAQDESNDYCLQSRDDARDVLSRLKTVDVGEVHSAWGGVLTGYGLDHPFTDRTVSYCIKS